MVYGQEEFPKTIIKYKITHQQLTLKGIVNTAQPLAAIDSSRAQRFHHQPLQGPCGFYVFKCSALTRTSFLYNLLLTKRSTWAPFPDPFPWPFPWSSLYTVGYKLDLVPVAAIVALLHCVLCGCEDCGPRTRSSTGNRPVGLLRNGRKKRPSGTNKLYF